MTKIKNRMSRLKKKRVPASMIPVLMAMTCLGVVVAYTLFAPILQQNLVLKSDDEQIILTAETPWNTDGFRGQVTFTNVSMDVINEGLTIFNVEINIYHETADLTSAMVTPHFQIFKDTDSVTPVLDWAVMNVDTSTPIQLVTGVSVNIETHSSFYYWLEAEITFEATAPLGQYTMEIEVFTNS